MRMDDFVDGKIELCRERIMGEIYAELEIDAKTDANLAKEIKHLLECMVGEL